VRINIGTPLSLERTLSDDKDLVTPAEEDCQELRENVPLALELLDRDIAAETPTSLARVRGDPTTVKQPP
jgi:hypothetical protein